MKYLFLVFLLAGCATIQDAPQTMISTQDSVRKNMQYEYLSEFLSGKDIWSSGCPQKGDCEDVALCFIEKFRKEGKSPRLYRFMWNNPLTPWAHMMVRVDEWFIDYREATKTPEVRRSMTHECVQLSHVPNQPSWSTKGVWKCVATDLKSKTFLTYVE